MSGRSASNMISESSRGVFAISATPFSDNGSLDVVSADTLVDFYLECGVDGLTILGMMGEASKLSADESAVFVSRILARVGGRIPVIVGVSNLGTDNMISLVNTVMELGAAGVMITPIPTLRTEIQVIDYFVEVCGKFGPDVPVVLQDFPQATGVNMSARTVDAIITKCENVVIFKHEDYPGLSKLSQLRASELKSARRRISILVGNGGLFLPQELSRGADGAMTGFAYPEMLVDVCRHFASGDPKAGEDLFDIYLPLVRYEAQPGIGLALRKEVLRRRGAISSAHVRAPAPKLTVIDYTELALLVQRLELKLSTGNRVFERDRPLSM